MWYVYNIILTTKLLVITLYWHGCAKQKWIKSNWIDTITLNWEMCAQGKLLPLADVPAGAGSPKAVCCESVSLMRHSPRCSDKIFNPPPKKKSQHNKHKLSCHSRRLTTEICTLLNPSVFFCATRSEEIMVWQIGTSKFLWNIYLLCVDRPERAGTSPHGHLINLALKEEKL